MVADDLSADTLINCLDRDPRSHVINWVSMHAPPTIIPAKPVKHVRTGRWGRVLIRTHTAVKIQKVVCRDGRLQQVEWRDGPVKTKIALDAFQELIATQLFGILDIGPTVKHVLLARHIPAWVDDPENKDHKCWYLIIVMQRMRGTMRDIKHMPPARAAEVWATMDPNRLADIVVRLADLNVDHGDLRMDNVMYTISRDGVKPCLADFGYCKVKPSVGFKKLARDMGAQLAAVLKEAGGPDRLSKKVRALTAQARRPTQL